MIQCLETVLYDCLTVADSFGHEVLYAAVDDLSDQQYDHDDSGYV